MDIKPGDLVYHRTGGPLMVIDSIEGKVAHCSWWDADVNTYNQRSFVYHALEPANIPSPNQTTITLTQHGLQ